MTILSWHDQYLIGNTVIDDEHKELFRLINDFHSKWTENRDKQAIKEVLNNLIQYCQTHFSDEEAIMAREGYVVLESHRKYHEKLVEDIFKLNQELVEKHTMLEHDLNKFLKHWLVDHIVHCDYDFRDFLVRKRRAQPSV
jgi:hemerythrin